MTKKKRRVPTSKRTDWSKMTKEVRALLARLEQQPNPSYLETPEGVVDALQSAKIRRDGAIRILRGWKYGEV